MNVALTRARAHFIVVGDWKRCADGLGPLAAIAGAAQPGLSRYVSPGESDQGSLVSNAEKRLYREMLKRGLTVEPKFNWHHFELDFLVNKGGDAGALLDVEVDEPAEASSARVRSAEMSRDDLLSANGYTVMRVPAWRCLIDPTAVVDEIVG